jgi:hypothetical protein
VFHTSLLARPGRCPHGRRYFLKRLVTVLISG